MSKIINDGLTLFDTGCFRPIAVPIMATVGDGRQWVNAWKREKEDNNQKLT